MRLVILRNLPKMGNVAYRKAMLRSLLLLLVGFIVYHLDGEYRKWEQLTALGWSGFFATAFWRSPFQALVHIGVTTFWVLPVIARTARIRMVWMAGSAVLHLLLSYTFWYELLRQQRVIDGGPLGFLTWTIPTLAGSLAYDVVRERSTRDAVRLLIQWGAGLAVFGYALSCLNAVFNSVKPGGLANWLVEPPFWAPSRPVVLWTMSQQAGTNSYLWFSAGFSLLVYGAFVWWTDERGQAVPIASRFWAKSAYRIYSSRHDCKRSAAVCAEGFAVAVGCFYLCCVFRNSMAVSLGARPTANLHAALGPGEVCFTKIGG